MKESFRKICLIGKYVLVIRYKISYMIIYLNFFCNLVSFKVRLKDIVLYEVGRI